MATDASFGGSGHSGGSGGDRGGGGGRGDGGSSDGGAPGVVSGDLAEEARRKYLNYALSVITSRAIPDVRDGLKPVHRRILYTMFADLGLTHEARHRKSAKVVGDVIGKYHPHGDTAVYDAMVRLAQDFAMREPLVDGQGNFGSIDGDSAAAYRYTEAKLTKIASELLVELRKETVEFRPTYDGTGKEPIVLPARFPQLLVNGSTGIAVGMATSVPPHNLGEVVKACVALIDDPSLTVKQLVKRSLIRGPDFPTGGQLVASRSELIEIYEAGKGSCKLRGSWRSEVKQSKSRRGSIHKLIITAIPYGVEKSALVEEIGNIVLSKKLPSLIGVQDLSTREIRVELELKPKSDPELVIAYLLKRTRLQTTVKFDFTCLTPTDNPEVAAPQRLNVAEILTQFVEFRVATVRRRFEYELRKLEERIHILEGFELIFDDLDKAIRIIRRSDGKADAASKLIKEFGLDELQADAILEIKLYRLAKLEILRIREELEEKRRLAKKIRAILRSAAKLRGVVKDELIELAETYDDKRRTKIDDTDVTEEFTAESFIVEEDAYVLITRGGWLKRQRRINLATTRMREGDEALAVVAGSTRESVVLFTNYGTAYTIRINDIPASSGHGTPVQKLCKFKDGERVIAAVGTDARVMEEFAIEKPELGEEYEEPYPHMLAVTRGGQSLRFTLWGYKDTSTSRGRRFGRVKDDDEFISVFKVYADDNVCGVTAKGRVLCCNAQDVNLLTGPGSGVSFIKLASGDELLGVFPANADVRVEKTSGTVLKLSGSDRSVTRRGGKGTSLFKRGTAKQLIYPELDVRALDGDEVPESKSRSK
ncbi:MAG: DNA topoisomerase 4 subunit A [Myxococcales bacterium]|nr:DNA topoisomerase 4 subunit A [Myxococcales bacterium]